MARHLHEQSGGDPSAQGPVPELANEPASPRADHDFPDTPEGNRPRAGGGDLTDEQLDDFAVRLGLVDGARSGQPDDDEPVDEGQPQPADGGGVARPLLARPWLGRLRAPTARMIIAVGRAATTAGDSVRSFGERLERR